MIGKESQEDGVRWGTSREGRERMEGELQKKDEK